MGGGISSLYLCLLLALTGVGVAKQPTATNPTTWPYRSLEWGELNIIHTTDTHSWLGGHLHPTYPEPLYSGDFGDYYSFIQHMRSMAEEKGVDLLLVDSGDLHDGNGLGDADPVIRGHSLLKDYWTKMGYDVMAIGNHELYDYDVTYDVHASFVPSLPNPSIYLSSNANITLTSGDPKSPGIISTPVGGNRYRKFKTRLGRKVTAFGVLFGFEAHSPGVTVQDVDDMVKEEWFLHAIKERPDVFILAGHMDVRDTDWEVVVHRIRQSHPHVPILVLGGHHHVRDCRQLDSRSMSLASGRYMETVGFMSVSGLDGPVEEPLKFTRRYLDANRNTYIYHTNTSDVTFDTPIGNKMTKSLTALAQNFNISYVHGEAPQAYWVNRYPVTNKNSLVHLLVNEIFPAIVDSPTRKDIPHIIIFNTGGVRYDVFAGPFTNNDQYITMPFQNKFLFVPFVDPNVATALVKRMNDDGASRRRRRDVNTNAVGHTKDKRDVQIIFQEWKEDMYYRWRAEGMEAEHADLQLTDGYVTFDLCEGRGDDVKHRPVPVVSTPDFAATSLLPEESMSTKDGVDIVFFDFIWQDILSGLNKLQNRRIYTEDDIQAYNASTRSHTILNEYASLAWK